MTPDQYTNQELFLDVGDGHQIYVHDWGNAKAKTPIFFMHGGPGNGCDDKDKKKFDPTTQRVVFHDQRGSGKSLPKGELEHNTASHLVDDISKIVDKLGLAKILLVGGSWGSTLSLLYGIAHPEKVAGMVIDGVFTATKVENEWLEQGGWRTFFPEVWEEYVKDVPESHRSNPSTYYFQKALHGKSEEAKKASYEYLKMELALLKLDDRYQPESYDKFDPAGGLIEIHYLANHCFVDEGYILHNVSKLKMPIAIIQGRYDMVCPPRAAHDLHKALPNSQLIMTINGHLRQHEAANIQRLLINQMLGNN